MTNFKIGDKVRFKASNLGVYQECDTLHERLPFFGVYTVASVTTHEKLYTTKLSKDQNQSVGILEDTEEDGKPFWGGDWFELAQETLTCKQILEDSNYECIIFHYCPDGLTLMFAVKVYGFKKLDKILMAEAVGFTEEEAWQNALDKVTCP